MMRSRYKLLIACVVGLALLPQWLSANEPECTSAACAEEAPYVLRIINSGEADPRSSNSSPDSRQENRRVDVTLTHTETVTETPLEARSVTLESGGTIWLSQDPGSLQRVLTVKSAPRVSLESDTEHTFEVINNYASFIDRLELLIWRSGSSVTTKPLLVQALDASLYRQEWNWDTQLSDSLERAEGVRLEYALRAIGTDGHSDMTERQSLVYIEQGDAITDGFELPVVSFGGEFDDGVESDSALIRESIPVRGATVRILGQDLPASQRLRINSQTVQVDKEGRFALELLMPDGKHEFAVRLDEESSDLLQTLSVDIDSNYLFMVGLADVTVGANRVTGSVEPLSVDEDRYGGDIFVDGRLAFYLKGKVKGKYLVTAQMDTGTDDFGSLFDNFHERDSRSVFRHLDPDQYYPVYGDDSILIDDTDSQGKLYVRVDWDRSRFIWGSFNTNFTGTELASLNRSLYGAQLLHESTRDTDLGDARHSVSTFASRPQSLLRRNEFLGTGGSLYYLRDTQIVAGSEKVAVEVRQSDSGRVVDRVVLIAGRDYDIDDFQGRLLLRRPLVSVTAQSGPSIIRDVPLAGNQTYLVVDYEYSPDNLDFNDTSVGARVKKWLGNHIGVGGTWAHEQRDGADYDIKGADVTIKKSEQTYIKGEFAQSSAQQTAGSFLSSDGGLSFDEVGAVASTTSGNAFSLEARASLVDFKPGSRPLDIGVWARRTESGFSTSTLRTDVDTSEAGVEMAARPSNRIGVSARGTWRDRRDESVDTGLAAQIDYLLFDRLTVSTELSRKTERNRIADTRGEATLVGAKLSFDASDRLNIYAVQQETLTYTGSYTRNNLTALGARYDLSDRTSINGEISTGDRGDGALLGLEASLTSNYSIYSNYLYSLNSEQIDRHALVLGQRLSVSSQLKVYTEHQFSDEDGRNGYAHTVGLDQRLTRHATVGLTAQRAALDSEDGTRIDRDSVSTAFAYQADTTRFNSKFEYRWDDGSTVETRQWVTTNRLELRPSASLRWQVKLNASVTDDRIGVEDARFVEAGVGFAFRPISQDRLNMLGRVTYLNDLQPLSQSTGTDERSLIASIEGYYELTRHWSVGGKLARRESEIRLRRDSGVWIGNDAGLVSGRVRYKVPFGFDVTGSYHWLISGSTQSERHGALFTVGRRISDNLNFAIGYNFTSFDDDLGDDSYDARGWFVNLVGTY